MMKTLKDAVRLKKAIKDSLTPEEYKKHKAAVKREKKRLKP